MAIKTIDQLDPIKGNFTSIESNLTSVFGSNLSNYTQLFSLSGNDYIPISRFNGNGTYTTVKLPVAQFEYWMQKLSENAISTHLSAALNLCSLAWKNETDLRLGNLAKKNYVLSSQIFKADNNQTTQHAIPLESIDSNWGNLRTKDKITSSDVDVEGLPLTAVITEYKSDPLKTKGLALSTLNDLHLGDLSSKNESYLNLSTLSHKRYIDLSWHLSTATGVVDNEDSRKPGAAPVVGFLPKSAIKDYQDFALGYATGNEIGGLKLGYSSANTTVTNRDYAVCIQEGTTPLSTNQGKAYVHIPWTDSRFNMTDFSLSGGINSLNLSFNVKRNVYTDTSNGSTSTTLSTFTTTITPQIQGNVIANLLTEQLGNALDGHFALFATNSTKNEVYIKPYLDAKIDKSSTAPNYFKEDGTWSPITLADRNTDGLLVKTDYSFIQELKDNLPRKKAGSTFYYVLPEAANGQLGGIQLFDSTKRDVAVEDYFGRTDLISLPVRINSQNKAYVNILRAAGNQAEMASTITTAVDSSITDTLKKLYPVGAIYITTDNGCPLSALIPGSVWTPVNGRYILASGQIDGTFGAQDYFTASKAGVSTATAGLPSHTHNIDVGCGSCSCSNLKSVKNSHVAPSKTVTSSGPSGSIYGASQTVRPPAFVVNVYMRTK